MADASQNQNIDALMAESRTYPPDAAFTAQANAQPGFHDQDPDQFWEKEGRERLSWFTDFTTLKQWDRPYAKWYLGGTLNACYNCVDRHVENGLGDKVAYYWEGEPVDERLEITYGDLQSRVVKAANGFKSLGIGKGTKVAVYMGMIPEAPVTLLALARLGAPFTFVFGGFSANALGSRMVEMGCEYLITQDAANRRGAPSPLKPTADEAMAMAPTVTTCITVRRTGSDVAMQDGRDHWWHDAVDSQSDDPASCPCEPMDSEDLFFLMFSSGTTGRPKGILHTTAGYLAGVSTTHHYVFDIKPDSVYWCAADIGWITGHSYIVFGPLINGTTSVMYEGTPDFPDKSRWWQIIERYKVTVLYTAPTTIRTHMKWGTDQLKGHDLSSLKVLGSVGEPINPEAWVWYRDNVGGGKAPVVDTWWQTETGMIMVTPLPGVTTLKPGSATKPFVGVQAAVYDEAGKEIAPGEGAGYMVVKEPWPAMFRGLLNDDQRFKDTYWSQFSDAYLAGDGARVDEDGDFWMMGRIDDVMNVSGHRLSTIEVESALVSHPDVAQAAVVSRSDPTTGQAIVAYVTLRDGAEGTTEKLKELREHVGTEIGPIAKPANVVFADSLPMTRSGKIMRRLLKDVAENRELGDTTTLADPSVVNEIKDRATSDKDNDKES